MTVRFISAEEVRAALTYERAIGELETAFAGELPHTPQRTVLHRGDGQFLVMPSWGDDGLGIKLVTVNPRNPDRDLPLIQGVYVLFSADSLEPVALIDAVSLTAIRTAAVSAVATKHLARPEARRLVVFGSGVQAEGHVEAMAAVRPLDGIVVVPRSSGGASALIETLGSRGLRAREGSAIDVSSADVVCTCTTSTTPLFDGDLLAPGTHVNAIGTHQPDAREVDTATVARSYVVVETRESARAEAGDLLVPLAEGAVTADDVPAAELAEVIRGVAPPIPEGSVTLFKSVGVAFEDLALAQLVWATFRKS